VSSDTLLIVLGCGLALLCAVVLVVVGVFVLRLTTRGIFPVLGSLRQQFSEEREADNEKVYAPEPRPNLRAIAQQHDFNSALAQQVIENQIEPPPPPPITVQNAPFAPTTPPLEPRAPDTRFGSRRPNDERQRDDGRRRDYDDEVLGGMLDIDGDGDPDL